MSVSLEKQNSAFAAAMGRVRPAEKPTAPRTVTPAALAEQRDARARSVAPRPQHSAHPLTVASAVALEQLEYWRAQGISNEDIFREITMAAAPHLVTRDELLGLIAAAWLGVAG